MDNKYKSLGKNTILVFIGKFGSGIITFLMLPLYTNWLSPEAYGLAELVNTYANILFSIATCCMADAIFIFPKTSDNLGKSKYYSSGLFVALIGIVLIIIGALVVSHESFIYLGTICNNSIQIVILSVSLFLQNYTQQFTRSIDKMKVYSICGIIQTFFVALFAFLLVPRWGGDGYIYSFVFANVLAAIYTVWASKSYIYLSVKYIDRTYSTDLLKYGIPLIPNSVMWWLVDGINKPIMEVKLGLGAIGIYTVASKFPSVLNVVTGAFSNAWGISVSEEYGKEDFNLYFNRVFKFIFFILMLFSLMLSMMSEIIISVFVSPDYTGVSLLLPILLLSVILSNASGLFGGIFMARKQSKYFFYSSIIGAVTSLGSIVLFIKFWNISGVAWSSVLSFLAIAISRAYFVWKDINKLEINYYIKSIVFYLAFLLIIDNIEGLYRYVISLIMIALFLYINRTMISKVYIKYKDR